MLTTGRDLAFVALVVSASFAAGCGGALDASQGPIHRDASSETSPEASVDLGQVDSGHVDVVSIEIVPIGACGNGILELGEQCDDGNRTPGDGCTALCQIADGAICPTPGRPCTFPPACGDGVSSATEACDDGNRTDGDGCSADCTTIEAGWICPVPGRRCVPICGDRQVTAPETCDDGNRTDGDGCSSSCLVESGCDGGVSDGGSTDDGSTDGGGSCTSLRCGDGIVSGAEQCDDGAANDSNAYGGCTSTCLYGAFCGDGLVNGPEECDLGTRLNTATYGADGCTSACRRPHYCGDGIVDSAFGEQCDLGANNGGDGPCSQNCLIFLL